MRPRPALREFLAHALAHNLRCVRIIHGKGKNSGPRGPVIKTAVNMILRKTGPVLAFTSARRVDGGTGAINVLLIRADAGLIGPLLTPPKRRRPSALLQELRLQSFLRRGREPHLGAHRAELALAVRAFHPECRTDR